MIPAEIRQPKPGEVVSVTAAASVQFVVNPILFRVIRVHPWETYTGWVWMDGYQLSESGEAVERRTIWVQPEGLIWVGLDPPKPAGRRAPRNTRPVAVPRPRQSPEPTTTTGAPR